MASNMILSIKRSGLIRKYTLGTFQRRNVGSSPEQPQQLVKQASSALPLAVGLSLGLSVGLLAHSNLAKFFPKEPESKPEKSSAIDPKIVEFMVEQARKSNQLENELRNLRETINERSQPVIQAPQTTHQNVDTIELSQLIEAHELVAARRIEDQRKTLLREHQIRVEGEILKVENKYKPIINNIKELETHLELQNQISKKEGPTRLIWLSCQSLLRKIQGSPPAPLEQDPAYDILRQSAANNRFLDAIPVEALKKGVQSEDHLINRFSDIERTCRRVALVGESAGVTKYLLSFLQSLLVVDMKVSDDEVAGNILVDPTSWDTFQILARVKHCLRARNLEQAVKYANQLKGQARVVIRDWIRDARVHLETKQAFRVLSIQAESIAVDATRQSYVE